MVSRLLALGLALLNQFEGFVYVDGRLGREQGRIRFISVKECFVEAVVALDAERALV